MVKQLANKGLLTGHLKGLAHFKGMFCMLKGPLVDFNLNGDATN